MSRTICIVCRFEGGEVLEHPAVPQRVIDSHLFLSRYILSGRIIGSRGYWTKSCGPQSCVAVKAPPAEITPFEAENDIIFAEPKRVWDVRLTGVGPLGDSVVGRARIGTLIKQYLPVRDLEVRFQVMPGDGTGSLALVEGVSNDGKLDSVGEKFSFEIEPKRADTISARCGVELYEQGGAAYPTFALRDVMQPADKDRPVMGLSEQALCQIKEYGRYGYVDMVNMLSLVAKGLQGRVEDKIHAEDPAAMELLRGLQLRQ